MDKKLILEQRVARLEKLLKIKNESLADLSRGVRVMDADGNTGVVRSKGPIGNLRRIHGHMLSDEAIHAVNQWCLRVGSREDIGVLIKFDNGAYDICCEPNTLKIL